MKYWIGIILLAAFSFSACNSEPKSDEEKQAEMVQKLLEEGKGNKVQIQPTDTRPLSVLGNTEWTVMQLTYEGEDFPLTSEDPQPLRFSGWNISGGTCPRFGGSYDVPADGQLAVKEVRAPGTGQCDPSEAALSRRLRGIVESATSFEMLQDGQQLKISGEKGMVLCSLIQ